MRPSRLRGSGKSRRCAVFQILTQAAAALVREAFADPPEASLYQLRRLGVTPAVETAYLTSEAMDGAAQANPSKP